jgi:hypothetical protein
MTVPNIKLNKILLNLNLCCYLHCIINFISNKLLDNERVTNELPTSDQRVTQELP